DDEGRRDQECVAAAADQDAVLLIAAARAFGTACARRALARLQVDRGQQSKIANVGDMREVAQAMRVIFPQWRDAARALEQAEILIHVERGKTSRAGERMG